MDYCDLADVVATAEYVVATARNFEEPSYLAANPDVSKAIQAGGLRNGRQHFDLFGRSEGRKLLRPSHMDDLRAQKMKRIKPLLRQDMKHIRLGAKYDFLTAALREETGIADTHAISSHGYDAYACDLIEQNSSGILLDCGAGRRPRYYKNVVNYEIVNYDTTDIIGVGEQLPFKDNSFDGVLSLSVLEHVRDPFRCANELIRVLRPGGRLICAVPFLQPLHGYPHHYYNMSHQGLRALFERAEYVVATARNFEESSYLAANPDVSKAIQAGGLRNGRQHFDLFGRSEGRKLLRPSLIIDDHKVIESIGPIWTLTWIVRSWADGLSGDTWKQFLEMPLKTFMASAPDLLSESWVQQLSAEKNFELASATMLFAHKAPPGALKDVGGIEQGIKQVRPPT